FQVASVHSMLEFRAISRPLGFDTWRRCLLRCPEQLASETRRRVVHYSGKENRDIEDSWIRGFGPRAEFTMSLFSCPPENLVAPFHHSEIGFAKAARTLWYNEKDTTGVRSWEDQWPAPTLECMYCVRCARDPFPTCWES